MKFAIMAIVALALLGGGGYGAYVMLKPGDAEAAIADKAPEPAPEPVFVKVPPFVVPVIGDDRIEQMISLVVALEVAGAEAAAIVEAQEPRIRDALVSDLYGIFEASKRQGNPVSGPRLDIGALKVRLRNSAQRVFGDDVVNDVLIQVVSQRQL